MTTPTSHSPVIRELIDLIETRALKRGTFRLASGREASFYLDAKQVVLDARGAMLVGRGILELLRARSAGATICPSEAARAVAPEGWRELMEPARRAARRLVADGVVEITQSGRVVNPSTAKGPIRIRLATRQPEADGNRASRRADERS